MVPTSPALATLAKQLAQKKEIGSCIMVLGGGRDEIPVFQLHDDFMPWTLMIVRHIFFNVFFIHTMERFVHIMMPAAHLHLYMWIKF